MVLVASRRNYLVVDGMKVIKQSAARSAVFEAGILGEFFRGGSWGTLLYRKALCYLSNECVVVLWGRSFFCMGFQHWLLRPLLVAEWVVCGCWGFPIKFYGGVFGFVPADPCFGWQSGCFWEGHSSPALYFVCVVGF